MFDMSRIIISRIHPIIARSLHGDLRGRSVAAAPRGGAAAAQIKSLGRLRRLVDDSPGPSIRSLLSFACVSPIKSMGYFVRPGLVAVADISATLRVRFPFRTFSKKSPTKKPHQKVPTKSPTKKYHQQAPPKSPTQKAGSAKPHRKKGRTKDAPSKGPAEGAPQTDRGKRGVWAFHRLIPLDSG